MKEKKEYVLKYKLKFKKSHSIFIFYKLYTFRNDYKIWFKRKSNQQSIKINWKDIQIIESYRMNWKIFEPLLRINLKFLSVNAFYLLNIEVEYSIKTNSNHKLSISFSFSIDLFFVKAQVCFPVKIDMKQETKWKEAFDSETAVTVWEKKESTLF